MRKTALIVSVVVTVFVLRCGAEATGRIQEKAESVIGAIAEIDPNTKSATIKTDAGAMVSVKADENTVCLRIPAGEKTLAKAAPIQFADITIGDRVLAHGSKTDQGFVA